MKIRRNLILCFVCLALPVWAMQPLVAVHDSELTRALETMPATGSTPTGPGTTGYQWWVNNWHYFVMPETVKEALRSDGTAFQVVGDSNIVSGQLLDSNGLPAYPIVISLASEAINDSEIAQFTNYVAAGGFLFVGSSSFTRNPDGTPRGDFAFADAMGVHVATNTLANWVDDEFFTVTASNRIVSDIPAGNSLEWLAPQSADEITYGMSPNHDPSLFHTIWQVQPGDATVVAVGGTYANFLAYPYLLVKPYGKGYFIYDAAMQPLMGHNAYFPGVYTYMIFREAIDWAFESAKMPVPKLSPWPYPYNAAAIFRHDMEDFPDFINTIEASAQYEHSVGARGDYYFCTGTLRTEYSAADQSNEVASLQRAVTQDGATIGSHNGGLPNPYNLSLVTNAYDYWHWGPDEVLDDTNPPPYGFPDGVTYALTAALDSFSDLAGWGLTNGTGLLEWVAPSFNANREPSKQILQDVGIATAGEEKLTPFPHWTLSTETPGMRYSFVSLPPSDWYVGGGNMAQSVEDGHTVDTVHALINFYYNLGALIDLYSHSSSAGGTSWSEQDVTTNPNLERENVTYTMNTNLFPRLWAANADGIYRWWTRRSTAQITPVSSRVGNQSVTTVSIAGASDTNTAIEVLAPSPSCSGLQVYTNGILAGTNNYRTVGQTIRVLVGTSVTNAQILYTLAPTAQNDTYYVQPGSTLTVAAPGVLGNDLPGWGTSLTAQWLTGPTNGILVLNSDGSFAYTPTNGFLGADSFTYQANDGQTNSAPATVNITVMNAPVITAGPSNVTANAGATVSFSVNATSSVPAIYQWFQNGTNALRDGGGISGSATATLTLGGVLGGNAGQYTVVVSNPAGSVTSAPPALLSVADPVILATPVGAVQNNGNSVELSVNAFGTTPLAYQWLLDGQPIAGATNAVMVLAGVTNALAGSYSVTVSNVFGSVAASVPNLQTFASGLLFTDDFSRATDPGPISPWVAAVGSWTVTSNTLAATGLDSSGLANAYLLGTNWGDYSVQGEVQFPAGSYGGGLGGHLDPTTGAHYGAWIYPEGSPGGSGVLKLIKFSSWANWSGNDMAQVTLTNGVGTNWHSLNLTFRANEVMVYWDGNQVADVTDTGFDGTSAYLSGGICADVWAPSPALAMVVSNVVVSEFPPTITNQPQDVVAGTGGNVNFAVGADGTAPLTYQWLKQGVALSDGGNIYGSATASLVISNLSDADAAGYSVTISNAFGGVASSNATLTVTGPPVITGQPANATVADGGTASFTVQAGGSALSYQWMKDSIALPGATGPVLVLNNVSDSDAGNYSVSVSNVLGSVLSSNATLTVQDCFSPPPGLVGWWPAEGSANDIIGTNNGALEGGATAASAGVVGSAFSFDGTNGFVQIPDSPGLRPTNLTVEAWVLFYSLDSVSDSRPGHQYIVFKQNTQSVNFEGFGLGKDRIASVNSNGDFFYFNVSSSSGVTAEVDAASTVTTGVWYHVAGVRGPDYIQLYINGQLAGQAPVNFPQDYGTLPLYFGTTGQSYWDGKLNGRLDEVSLYDRPLSSNEIAAIYLSGVAGKCKRPVIVSQPQNQTQVAGGTAAFAVQAVGDLPLNYQWWKNNGPIPGATNSALMLTNLQSGDVAGYSVVITNNYGSVTSRVAALTLSDFMIVAQPVGTATNAGSTVNLSVSVAGAVPLTYQWIKNGTNILSDGANVQGAQTASLTLSNVLKADEGEYAVRVSDTNVSVTSSNAALTVADPVITSQPAGVVKNAGDTAVFTVGAYGTLPLSYQWFKNSTALNDGGNVSGSATAALTLGSVSNLDVADYTVVVSNMFGSVTSSVAQLQVVLPGSTAIGTLFADDFVRSTDPGPIDPWVAALGAWTVTGQKLEVTALTPTNLAEAYVPGSWSNYTVRAQVQFPAGSYGGGLGGYVNPATGERYAVWVYPAGSPGGSNVVSLVKFFDWSHWSFTSMQQVALTNDVGTNWHSLQLTFQANQIQASFDGSLLMNVTDNNFSGVPPYSAGGISADVWAADPSQAMMMSNVVVTPLIPDDSYSMNPNTLLAVAGPGVLLNNTDTLGTNMTAVLVSGTVNGTLNLNADGGFTYQPATNFVGTDRFVYQAVDGATVLGAATVTIYVGPVLTVTVSNQARAYGTANPAFTAAYSGFINGDATNVLTGAPAITTIATTNSPVGVYAVTVSQGTLSATNYGFVFVNGTLTVTQAQLTVASGLSADNKVYDGTTAATLSSNNVVLGGVLDVDTNAVALSTNGYVAAFTNAGVGTAVGVVVSGLGLTGSAAGNYLLVSPTNLEANIIPAGVMVVSGLSADNKVYDGTTAATLSSNNVVLGGVLDMDTNAVALNTNGYVAAFTNAGAGTAVGVVVSGLGLTGSAVGNYLLVSPTNLEANIIPAGVTVASGLSADNKVYDGTTAATLSSNNVVLGGVLDADTNAVALSTNGYVANFAGANVGTNISVNVSGLALTGNAAGNYALSQPANLAANITALTLTVSATNQSKTYGLPNPPLVVVYTGFINGEGTNVLAGAPSVSTDATTNSPPGTYPIVVGPGTLSATNYTFAFVNGNLTVVDVPQLGGSLSGGQVVFNWPTIANQTYQLEYKDDLTATNWTPLGAPIVGTGDPIIVTNAVGASPRRFFILVISP